MFNVHVVEKDKTKILLEADLDIVIAMVAAIGRTGQNDLERSLMNSWGMTSTEANRIGRHASDSYVFDPSIKNILQETYNRSKE